MPTIGHLCLLSPKVTKWEFDFSFLKWMNSFLLLHMCLFAPLSTTNFVLSVVGGDSLLQEGNVLVDKG